MTTQMRLIIMVLLVGLLTLFGCDKKNTSGPEVTDDIIIIKSVTPDSGITAGIITGFVVIVEYDLVSTEAGELNIGFNSDEVGRYAMIIAAKTLVTKGTGEHQFNVNVLTRDWGDDGNFNVYVNLSESPHGTSWTPLATDIHTLTF